MKKPWRYHGECCASGGPWDLPWDLPRHNIHHDTSSAFSNNVPICQSVSVPHLAMSAIPPGVELPPSTQGSSVALTTGDTGES